MPHLLQGPRLRPVDGQRPSGLVVLLHGYSMSGHDMMPLARMLQASLPEVEFVAPHGHLPLAGGGRAWMALRTLAPAEFWDGAVAARPILDHLLDAERESLELPEDRVVLLGFSQGAVLALHIGLRQGAAPAAIIGYSGLLAGPEYLEDEVVAHPPVTLIHGELDAIVSFREMEAAATTLRTAGIPVSTHLARGAGHTITPEGASWGLRAIREAFASYELAD